jgi:hypothetical protein
MSSHHSLTVRYVLLSSSHLCSCPPSDGCSSAFQAKLCVHFWLAPRVLYDCKTHPSWFDHPNSIRWRVQIIGRLSIPLLHPSFVSAAGSQTPSHILCTLSTGISGGEMIFGDTCERQEDGLRASTLTYFQEHIKSFVHNSHNILSYAILCWKCYI